MTQRNDKTSRITFAEEETQGARIKVVGVGGGGGNAISRMIASGLQGVVRYDRDLATGEHTPG